MQLILEAPCSASLNTLTWHAAHTQNIKIEIHLINSETCCTDHYFNPQLLQVIINLIR